jgi:hypothetical protein
MPECSDCGRTLPGLETLCSACFESSYFDLGRPKSLLESIRQPKRRQLAENPNSVKARQPWWLVSCWAIGGLGFAWDCAFEWFSRRYSLFAEPVLDRTGAIVVLCSAVALLAVCVVRGARLRDAAAVFCITSIQIWFFLTTEWVVHPTRWK